MPRTPKTEPSIESKFRAAGLSPAFAQRTNHRLILGDAREMHELTDPVHLVVTSPPYWTLKEYDGAAGDRQLGHWDDYESFHDELDKVWRRCYELLVPGGQMCVVIGDVCLPRRRVGRHLLVM